MSAPAVPLLTIHIDDYPELRALCWNRPQGEVIDGAEALALYERSWRHVDQAALVDAERALIAQLIERFGNGVLHV